MQVWTELLLAVVGVILVAPELVRADGWDYWKTTVFYQIYPRSFKDSDGDGTGDLKGITAELEHLVDMGFGAVWMSPIFTSPMADFGYDISDFYGIDPIFGTMDDFKALVARANELDIKVILDFVPNHSSDESDWFIKSKAKDPDYDDFYIWMDPLGFDNSTGIPIPIPPNEWIGAFSESVWTYAEEREQFYYHRYNFKQPDLNYRNEAVKQEMENILTFWLDNGAHGFRVDTIHTLVESGFPNVPDSEKDIYSICQPETYEIVQQWRKLLDDYSAKDNLTRVLMTEGFGSTEQVMEFYGNQTNPGAHFTFNFKLFNELNNTSSAQDFVNMIYSWMDNMPAGATANWVMGNHDQGRVATRYGNELAAGLAMMTLLLPGVGVTYNGEEIGMVNNMNISYEDTLDPAGVNGGPDNYRELSRDFERTPFQWDGTDNAGFSSAEKTWLPVHVNYKNLNLAQEKTEDKSYYHIYKSLIELRNTDTFKSGSLNAVALSENVFSISRESTDETIVVVVNLGADNEIVDLTPVFNNILYDQLNVFTSSIASNLNLWDTVETNNLQLHPKSSVVLVSPALTSNAITFKSRYTLSLMSVILALRFLMNSNGSEV